MPKMKPHKASKRRLRITSTGKVMRTKGGVRHLLADRSPKTMRNRGKKASIPNAGHRRKVRQAFLVGLP